MHGFEVHSNESVCRKKDRLGLEQVVRHMDPTRSQNDKNGNKIEQNIYFCHTNSRNVSHRTDYSTKGTPSIFNNPPSPFLGGHKCYLIPLLEPSSSANKNVDEQVLIYFD